MKSLRLHWLVYPLLVLGVASEARYYLRQESLLSSEEQLAVEALNGSIEPVRRRFQAGEGRWRVVVLASPMAPTSVASVLSLLDDFLRPAPELPVEVSVVFSPVLPWDQRSKARTLPRFVVEDRWRFFWDPENRVSKELLSAFVSEASELEGRYLVYPPAATWSSSGPAPSPTLELLARRTSVRGTTGDFALDLARLRERIVEEAGPTGSQ